MTPPASAGLTVPPGPVTQSSQTVRPGPAVPPDPTVQSGPAVPPDLSGPAAPPGSARDASIDVARSVSLTVVVLLHALMVGVSVGAHGLVMRNALDGWAWFPPLSWLLQIMPVFFFAGGYASFHQWQRLRAGGGRASDYVRGRVVRLIAPAVVLVGVLGVGLAALSLLGVPAPIVAAAELHIAQPLWFLPVYLGCTAVVPVLARVHGRMPLRLGGLLLASVVLVDVLRSATGVGALGYLNLAFVWLLIQQFGFFLADGALERLTVRLRLGVAAGALLMLLALTGGGLYSPDMLVNLNPPTLCLVLLGLAQLMVFSVLQPRIRALMTRRRVAAAVRTVGARAMSVYLWHMPVLITVAGALVVTHAWLPDPLSPGWWATRPLWLAAIALAVVPVVRWASVFDRPPAGPTPSVSRPGEAFAESAQAPLSSRDAAPVQVVRLGRGAFWPPLRCVAAVVLGVAGTALVLVLGLTPATALLCAAAFLAALRLTAERPPVSSRKTVALVPVLQGS